MGWSNPIEENLFPVTLKWRHQAWIGH